MAYPLPARRSFLSTEESTSIRSTNGGGTRGVQGVEPDPVYVRLLELDDAILVEPDDSKRRELIVERITLTAENYREALFVYGVPYFKHIRSRDSGTSPMRFFRCRLKAGHSRCAWKSGHFSGTAGDR